MGMIFSWSSMRMKFLGALADMIPSTIMTTATAEEKKKSVGGVCR